MFTLPPALSDNLKSSKQVMSPLHSRSLNEKMEVDGDNRDDGRHRQNTLGDDLHDNVKANADHDNDNDNFHEQDRSDNEMDDDNSPSTASSVDTSEPAIAKAVRPKTAGTVLTSFRSLASGFTSGKASNKTNGHQSTTVQGLTRTISSLKMERNLLERMLQERDEKISSLMKSIQVQNEHVNTLQAKAEVSERRAKQVEQRHQLQIGNLEKENTMLKSQLEVMHREIVRINDDPIHQALISSNNSNSDRTRSTTASGRSEEEEMLARIIPERNSASGRSEEEEMLARIMPAANPFADVDDILWHEDSTEENEDRNGSINTSDNFGNGNTHTNIANNDNGNSSNNEEQIKLANSAQGILLQSQLYQALSSLKHLRQQTRAMKTDYDEIIVSLQKDLVQTMDDKARAEASLLSQLSHLDQTSKVTQRSLEDKIVQKESRIKRLEDRITALENIANEGDADMSYAPDDGDGIATSTGGSQSLSIDSNTNNALSSIVPELPLHCEQNKSSSSSAGRLLQEKELKVPVSFSDLFVADNSNVSPTRKDAVVLLERTKSRAKMILERTASTGTTLPGPIMEEGEEDDSESDEDEVEKGKENETKVEKLAANQSENLNADIDASLDIHEPQSSKVLANVPQAAPAAKCSVEEEEFFSEGDSDYSDDDLDLR